MDVRRIAAFEELVSLEADWNRLAGGMPLRSWDWLTTWWKHYGTAREGSSLPAKRELYVLAIYRETAATNGAPATTESRASELIGVAPWYLDRTVVRGNVVRWLGSGEVCSDHLSLLCRPKDRLAVASATADALTTQLDDWDCLDLSAVDEGDSAVGALLTALKQRDCVVTAHRADSCWIVDLPATWDKYLATISKSHRKQLRRLDRNVLGSNRAAWHRVQSAGDLGDAWPILVDLHQRRRRSLGEAGCFASRSFHEFHREVAARLLKRGQLRMSWLELDGKPAAAEYNFQGKTNVFSDCDGRDGQDCPSSMMATYAYQGGLDPDRLSEQPGRLSMTCCVRAAIDEGHRQFDFLRGDEPYKAHWRATPRGTYDYHVLPDRPLARLRGRVQIFRKTMSIWSKHGARIFAD